MQPTLHFTWTNDSPRIYEGHMQSKPETFSLTLIPKGQREIDFNRNWRVSKGDLKDGYALNLDISSWQLLDLPHDFSIELPVSTDYEAESGFYPGGIRWYRKHFILDQDHLNHHVALAFDGIYQSAEIYLNGEKVAEHHHGYSPFEVNISDYLYQDGKSENQIAIKVSHHLPSSRWYSGSGIYRDVKLIVTDRLHFAPKGMTLTSPNIAWELQNGEDVETNIELVIHNDHTTEKNFKILTEVIASNGERIGQVESPILYLKGKEQIVFNQTLAFQHPKLWSLSSPNLYQFKSSLISNDKVYDCITSDYGFRYFYFDRESGFSLNGQNIKLKGVNLHHDNGALGAVANLDAIREKLIKLKEMGANAIRTSHNPTSQNLIDEANRQGFLVIEEAFDGWDRHKNGNIHDFSRYFHQLLGEENARNLSHASPHMTWAEYSLRSMIHRGKNAPSIIMWSIGNEIGEGTNQNTDHYNILGPQIISWIQEADPTRPMTIGANWPDTFHPIYQAIIDAGGVMGYNYLTPERMEKQRKLFPTAKMYGSETTSAIHSRGEYSTKGRNASTLQLTEYDNDQARVGWGHSASIAWQHAIEYDWNAGIFVWTGYDYIGEPTPWNGISPGSVNGKGPLPNSSYFGIIDTAGLPKDTYWLYRSMWREDAYTLNLMSTWNLEEIDNQDGFVQVDVYTNATRVELYLNNQLIGEATCQTFKTQAGHTYHRFEQNKPYPSFIVQWQAGTLSAKAYDQEDNDITHLAQGRKSIATSYEATKIQLTTQNQELNADGKSLAYVEVSLLDYKGNLVTHSDHMIHFHLTGPGRIVGVDNGNSADGASYKLPFRKTFHGRALVIIQSEYDTGQLNLQATSQNLVGDAVSLLAVKKETLNDAFDVSLSKYHIMTLGQNLNLPKTLSLIQSQGQIETVSIDWNIEDDSMFKQPGLYPISGSIKEGAYPIIVWVKVIKPIVSLEQTWVRTYRGQRPNLPSHLKAFDEDGNIALEAPVEWKGSNQSFDRPTFITLKGNVALLGNEVEVEANILIEDEIKQINLTQESEDCPVITHGYRKKQVIYPLGEITQGLTDGYPFHHDSIQTTWTTYHYHDDEQIEDFYIQLSWKTNKCFANISLWHFTQEDTVFLPGDGNIKFDYWDHKNHIWKKQDASNITQVSYKQGETTYGLMTPITSSQLRIWFKQPQVGQAVGLSQIEVLSYVPKRQLGTTCNISQVKVDGRVLKANPSSYTYFDKSFNSIQIETQDFASPTVIKTKSNDLHIYVQSEDGQTQKTYFLTKGQD